MLLFLIDAGDPDPAETRAILEKELAAHSEAFAQRPSVCVLNKLDVTENRERAAAVAAEIGAAHCISAATGEGVPELTETLWELVERARKEEDAEVVIEPEREYAYEPPFQIHKVAGGYDIAGQRVVRAVRMTDFENREGVRHLQETLERMGVFKALKRVGAKAGDTIFIGDAEMEYQPD